jgi:small nuclear ribonucleoprotein (snRNP)-like protein
VPGLDDVGTVTQSSTARERERVKGENGIERSGSVVSFDSVVKTYDVDAEEGRVEERRNTRRGARTKRLSHGKAVGDRLTHENLQWHTAHSSKINPLIYRFMSPIGASC